MVVFPTLWLIGHLILLHYWQRKNVLSSLFAPRRMIAMPLYSTLWSDTLGSMMILYMVHGFDGSQNDYLYVLWLTFFIKIGLYLAITKRHKRGYLWMDILFLMVGFFLTFIIYSLAATV
jgi:hypothetical protein